MVVVIGALALMVGVVEAGPAAAAKRGNNDTANLCQQGGWQTLVTGTGEERRPRRVTRSSRRSLQAISWREDAGAESALRHEP